MDWKSIFLSYQGRINRKPYWLANLVFAIFFFGFFSTVLGLAGVFQTDPSNPEAMSAAFSSVSWPLNIFNILSIWPAYAILAKRWHDRDKSGWWSLIMFVPIVGAIWVLVECGFLRGTEGPNRFGPDPLAE